MEDKEEFEMKLPNGVGEKMLAHAIDRFDVVLEHTEYGPKLVGSYEELEKVQDFLIKSIKKRIDQLSD